MTTPAANPLVFPCETSGLTSPEDRAADSSPPLPRIDVGAVSRLFDDISRSFAEFDAVCEKDGSPGSPGFF